jgi:hypothetical protein
MRRLFNSIKILAFLIAATLVGSASSEAVGIISFDQFLAAGGTISYDGTGGSLIGADIPFDLIRGIGTPFNSPSASGCAGCFLNFTTGANTAEGALYEWAGAPMGSFEVHGVVAAMGILVDSVLLTGTIEFARLDTGELTLRLGGADFKHPNIVDFFYGPGPDPMFSYVNTEILLGGINFEGGCQACGDGGFSADVTNADIDNIVPEPGSSLLILLGLGSLAAYRRRRS